MAAVLRRWVPFGLVLLASGWLSSLASDPGDWSIDAWPAVDALSHGRVSDYLSSGAMMGPFSTLVQAPFAALSGGGELGAYRWAAFPCLLAAGLLGLYLASIARRRGASPLFQALLAALCLLNPLTFEALENGHPEEILTAALAVAAVASAGEGRRLRTAVLLGLAVASKQWAVIAILPALMALPGSRLKTGLAAGAVALALMLPGLIASPEAFSEVQGSAANTGRVVTPWSVWYPLSPVETEVHQVGGVRLVASVHEAPRLVGPLSHPLIVLLAVALPLGLALRRRSFGISGADAMALLALLALLRSALDPVDNLYYHAPLLLALLGWDAFASPRDLPLRGLLGGAIALAFWSWSKQLGDVAVFNAAYLLLVAFATAAIIGVLWRLDVRTAERGHNFGRAPFLGNRRGNFSVPGLGKSRAPWN